MNALLSGSDATGDTAAALATKVAFLTQPASYSEQPSQVVAIETHMSWVFLTDQHAYKLKKPVRYEYLDFSTIDARRRDCLEEVRLNRRLAPDVYLGVVPLTRSASGQLQLNGDGQVEDWLVMMRRLPAQRMLDITIKERRVAAGQVSAIVDMLVALYRRESIPRIDPSTYSAQISREVTDNGRQLMAPQYRLNRAQIGSILHAQQRLLREQPELFEQRVRDDKIVEGHGDLRPEHICLEPTPVIIDCLEFKREFRVLDPADEIAFLAMECERLGGAQVAQWILDAYRQSGFDDPPELLVHFYKSYRACLRAKLAVWHLREPAVSNPAKWSAMAQQYLDAAERCTRHFD